MVEGTKMFSKRSHIDLQLSWFIFRTSAIVRWASLSETMSISTVLLSILYLSPTQCSTRLLHIACFPDIVRPTYRVLSGVQDMRFFLLGIITMYVYENSIFSMERFEGKRYDGYRDDV